MKFKSLIAPVTSAVMLSSVCTDAAWQNNGSEYNIGGLDTFLYVPATEPTLDGKRALMVSMHGCAQPNNDFYTGAGWPPVADRLGMVVALPQASGEGMYGMMMQCWNFHVGMNASRNSSDAKYVIDLVNELLADPSLNIDPDQVYVTGLSSGAGMTNQLACLAPDVFAGAGANAGPAPGSGGTDLSTPGISVSQGEANCKTLSNKDGYNNQDYLYSQIHNEVHGKNDGSVSPQHARRNAEIFVAVYDDTDSITTCTVNPPTIPGAKSGNHGDLTEWCGSNGKPRVSEILVNNMEHAWPAGDNSSGGGNYISHDHINYPEWIADWFFANNMRVDRFMNSDQDNDGVDDAIDLCPNTPEGATVNENGCPSDSDNDGILDGIDQCPNTEPGLPVDANGCELVQQGDSDNDGVIDSLDQCPNTPTGVNVDETGCEIPGSNCTEHTANNYNHVFASRAYTRFGFVYAVGSDESMGLYNIFSSTTLKETRDNYFEVGACN